MKGRFASCMSLAACLLVPACAAPATPPASPAAVPPRLQQEPAESTEGERIALLTGVRMTDGEIAVVADFARVLRGAEASAVAAERDPLFTNAKGYLVVNDEREAVTLPIASGAHVRCLAGDGPILVEVSPTLFLEKWVASDNGDRIRRDPYRLVLRDGRVTLLEQQYLR